MTDAKRIFVVLAAGFVLLGVNVTLQGVTWPSVAETFDRPLSNLGFVTLLFGTGYTLSTLISGRLAESPGLRLVLMAGAAGGILALTVTASSSTFLVFLAGAGLIGFAGGLLDAATNTHVAIEHRAREMGILHGAVGLGAIGGPLLITGLLAAGISWRFSFATLAALQLIYIVPLWNSTRSLVPPAPAVDGPEAPSLRTPVVFWSLAVFFLHNGVAATTGSWAFTFLTEGRGFDDVLGGAVVSGFFAGFTASRFILGAVGDRLDPHTVLRWSAVAVPLSLGVLWVNPTDWISIVALVGAGFAIGPIFPLEMLLTPARVGRARTPRLVGYEMAAGNVGAAVIPGVTGIAVGTTGLDVIPPLLIVLAILLVGAVERLRLISVRRSLTV